MGFFTDLKEDLSQAVNELIPEEEGRKPETARSAMEAAQELVPEEDEFASEEEIWAEKENWADENWADTSSDEEVTIKENMTEKLNSMLADLDEEDAGMRFGDTIEAPEPVSAAGTMAWADLKETAPTVAAETVVMAETEETVVEPEPVLAQGAAVPASETAGVGRENGTAAATETAEPVTTPAEPASATEPAAETSPVITEEPVTETTTTTLTEEATTMEESMVEMTAAETAAAEEMTTAESMETVEEAEAAPAEEAAEEAAEPERVISDEVAVVTAGMKIVGDLTSDGSMDVVGTVQGNIDIWGKLNISGTIVGNSKAMEVYAENARITGEITSEGSVKIGQSSVIIGNIYASSAVVAGAVKGDIDVQGPVILDTTAIVMGNIKSKSVQINNGAVIEGMCSLCYADVNPTSFFEAFK